MTPFLLGLLSGGLACYMITSGITEKPSKTRKRSNSDATAQDMIKLMMDVCKRMERNPREDVYDAVRNEMSNTRFDNAETTEEISDHDNDKPEQYDDGRFSDQRSEEFQLPNTRYRGARVLQRTDSDVSIE